MEHSEYNPVGLEKDNLILVSDAASMFRRVIRENDRPFVKSNKRWNNRRVDAWQKDLLNKVSRKGKLRAEILPSLWILYVRGQEVTTVMESEGRIPSCEEKEIDPWRDFFASATVEALQKRGKHMVAHGWALLQEYFLAYQMRLQWEKVFQDTTSPYEWYEKHLEFRTLFSGTEPLMPFWSLDEYKIITERVVTFLTFRSGPDVSGGFGMR